MKIITFGHKYRKPPKADMVVDCRKLPNPFYLIYQHDGTSDLVKNWLRPRCESFVKAKYQEIASKNPDTVAVGCVGGRHRSVFVAEELAMLLSKIGHNVTVEHMELGDV